MNRLENWAKGTIDIIKERLEMVNYESGPFKEKYPWAANYVSEGIATPKRNVAERNLFYDISKLLICPGERPYERGVHGDVRQLDYLERQGFRRTRIRG